MFDIRTKQKLAVFGHRGAVERIEALKASIPKGAFDLLVDKRPGQEEPGADVAQATH